MADLLNFFPLTIYRCPQRLDPEVKARLIDAVLEMAGTQPNKGEGSSWTGDVNGISCLHQDPRFAALFDSFRPHLRGYLEALKIDPDKLRLYYTRSWGTVAHGGEAIAPHRHLQSHISLVYYLQRPPQSGGIVFIDTESPNQFAPNLFRQEMRDHGIITEADIINSQAIHLQPEEGDVMIFPSLTRHGTESNTSGQPRLSIAVDIVATVVDSGNLEFLLPDLDRWTLAS